MKILPQLITDICVSQIGLFPRGLMQELAAASWRAPLSKAESGSQLSSGQQRAALGPIGSAFDSGALTTNDGHFLH